MTLPLKILLVEKSASGELIQILLESIKAFEWEVAQVTSVQAALEASQPINVILLDLSLDQGLNALNQLQKNYPQVAIVVMCNRKDEAEAQQALEMGASDYLIKEQIEANLLLCVLRYAVERQKWRKELEQAQQQCKRISSKLNLYHSIVSTSNNAIAIYDPQGYLIEQNAADRLLRGYEDQQLGGQSGDCDFDPSFWQICQQVQSKGSYQGEVGLRSKNGTLVKIEMFAFAHRDEKGEIISYITVGRDMTALRQVEASLKKRDRLMSGVVDATKHLLTTKDFAAAIKLALAALGNACGVDRVYMFENHLHPDTGELLMSQRFEWVNSNFTAVMDHAEVQNLSYFACFPDWYENLTLGKPFGGLVRLPQDEPETLEKQNILSILVVPIFLETKFWGFIGFDDCKSDRSWSDTEKAILTAAAFSIGGAIMRQQTEVALQKSEAKFRAIFEHSTIGIGLTDLDGWLIDANPALCKMLGYSREELLTMGEDYSYPNYIAVDVKLFQELVARKRDFYEIEIYIHKRGGIWGRLIVSLVRNSFGQPQFAICIIEDITSAKTAEIQLRDSRDAAEAGSRAKSEFLATMSHELRTPLNAILGLSQVLEQELYGELNPKQKECINFIYSSGDYLLALINDILNLSKAEAGKEELMPELLKVQDLCDDCLNIVRNRAADKNLQLICQICPQVDVCFADQRKAKQMLLNLLTNAIKFTHQGTVSLQVEKVPLGIAFKVSDTGIGIESSQINLLFQPFKQLDSRLNRQYEGTGLGLALTRNFARLHGGDVTVESSVGAGSQFTLLLPSSHEQYLHSILKSAGEDGGTRSVKTGHTECFMLEPFTTRGWSRFQEWRTPAPAQSTNKPPKQDISNEHSAAANSAKERIPTSKRILILEDDQASAKLLHNYLETIGYQVKHISQPNSFLETVRSLEPNLILLNVQPENSLIILDLLRSLRQKPEWQQLPVIIISAAIAIEQDRFLAAGANDYQVKPLGIAQIEMILSKYLG